MTVPYVETMHLTDDGLDACVERAAAVLKKGGVVLYPTDTLYGLGADALSDEAFERVCSIKERDEGRPMHAVFADMAMVERYAVVTPMGRRLAEAFLPGPLTLIFDKNAGVQGGIAKRLPTIGVRIPKNDFCLALARRFGKPFTTTSANKSGETTARLVPDIVRELGRKAKLVELAIDAGSLPASLGSTVVDARGAEPFIIREGVISANDIWEAVRPRAPLPLVPPLIR